MIWRVILFWLIGASLAWAELPRHSSVASVASCKNYTGLLNYWGHPLDGYAYLSDSWGLRTNITRQLGLTTNNVTALYDGIGEPASWTAKESSGVARLNEQLTYGYDAAGNLQSRTNGALNQIFTVNPLNQVSGVTSSGLYTVTGATPAPATKVTVNTTNTAHVYGDFTFAATNNPLATYGSGFIIVAQNANGSASNTVFSPPLSVSTSYDANGNLTYSGNAPLYYDAENRLTNMMNTGPVAFVYDGLNRLRIERYYTYQGGQWVQTNETRLIYDGMQVIQERDTNSNPLVTYTRGLDLSMTLGGAGGIGGMLARTDANGSTYFHSDGAGNITALMDGNQNVVARYEYDPYGRLINKQGSMADANRYRFSSKEYVTQAGIYCYGFRFYEPNFQRWLNRDPIQESGGINLYGFVGNNPVNFVDPYGDAWYNPWSWGLGTGLGNWLYSPGAARAQGVMALNAQLAANNTTLPQFQVDHPTWNGNGNLTAGNMQAAQAGANLGGAALEGEMNFYAAVLPGGIVGKEAEEALQASRTAIECKNGTKVNGFTGHGVDRAIGNAAERAGTTPEAILDALKNPLRIVSGVDSQGRPYQIFTGQDARVVINPQTGNVVSVNPLSGAGASQ
jgi:RHS repeat-associated protein